MAGLDGCPGWGGLAGWPGFTRPANFQGLLNSRDSGVYGEYRSLAPKALFENSNSGRSNLVQDLSSDIHTLEVRWSTLVNY